MPTAPLLVTLILDPPSAERFERERRDCYPPERNRVPAHVMLFHHLPGEEAGAIGADLARVAGDGAPFTMTITGLRSLGSGVAYAIESPDALALRATLASRWEHWLIPQDPEGYRPHVVIQNKVDRATAAETHERLTTTFTPFRAQAVGLELWRYLAGPWETVERFWFGGSASLDGDR